MNDGLDTLGRRDTDLKETTRLVSADEHREIVESECSDRVAEGRCARLFRAAARSPGWAAPAVGGWSSVLVVWVFCDRPERRSTRA